MGLSPYSAPGTWDRCCFLDAIFSALPWSRIRALLWLPSALRNPDKPAHKGAIGKFVPLLPERLAAQGREELQLDSPPRGVDDEEAQTYDQAHSMPQIGVHGLLFEMGRDLRRDDEEGGHEGASRTFRQ